LHILLLIIIVAVFIFLFTRGRSLFQVEIKNGKIIKSQGEISIALKDDFEMAVSGVKSGKIIGEKTQRGVTLAFRGDISEMTQQRLRNIVGIYFR
jgi:Protein of unknown function (DUF3634)